MMGELSNQAARQRTQDIHDVIAKPECSGIKIVEEQTGNWARTQGTDLMTNWISAGISSTRWSRTTTRWRSAPSRR